MIILTSESEKRIGYLFILFLIVIGLYYIYLASVTPMLGEDENTYFSLGKDFANSLNKQYDDFTFGKPKIIMPLFVSLFYSFFFLIFTPSMIISKAIIGFFTLLTLLIVYLIGRKFSIYLGFFSALLLLSITNFSHSSMLAYVETPIAFFSVLFTYLLLNMGNDRFMLKSVVVGVLLGISYHTKHSGLLLSIILFLYCITLYLHNKDKKYLKLFLVSVVMFSVMVVPMIIKNMIIYQYPHFLGMNIFFELPEYKGPTANVQWVKDATKLISPPSISLNTYISTLNYPVFIFSIFGISWLLSNFKVKSKEIQMLFLLTLLTTIFLFLFNVFNITGYMITEARYLSIIFPQISILAGFFLWKLKERNRVFLMILIPVILFCVFSGVTVAQGTSVSQRYPDDYVQALKWLKDNTPEDSIIFTAYGGSVGYFAERRSFWTINEFPDIMHSDNGTYIYENLKKYDLSYVLVWGGIVAQDYIVPQSNLIGAFTYNFINVVSVDEENFEIVYQNQNNIIFKLK